MKAQLGKLERVNLQKAWAHEAADFTPWLAQPDNLSTLADALGLLELNLVGTEHQVGAFKVDIVCEDDLGKVVIENQLAKTDHSHLGQILTYAAGVGARKVVWLAESFRTEHVAAVDFLNKNTTEELDFFAVEIELWKIGDSLMAPSFNVVAKPNNWVKAGQQGVKAANAATSTKQLQLKFWTEWSAWLQEKKSPLKTQKPLPQHWTNIALGKAGVHLAASVNTKQDRLTMEVYIGHANAKAWFKELEAQKQEIELELGIALTWLELPEGHACRILHTKLDAPLASEAEWPHYFGWLESAALQMGQVFKPRVKELA